MFRDEIWLTGSLSHANVVGLVGWGEDDGGPYSGDGLCRGRRLARIASGGRRAGEPAVTELSREPSPPAAPRGCTRHTSPGDDAGRPLDIVHATSRPAMILVGFDGSVKLTDFGIAKATGKSSKTSSASSRARRSYMFRSTPCGDRWTDARIRTARHRDVRARCGPGSFRGEGGPELLKLVVTPARRARLSCPR